MIRTGTLLENRYEILGKIGSGGMADVYKAKCHKLGRNVAVKILKPEYSNDETFVAKFRAEAQAAAGMVHPNVVNVYDVGDDKNLHYIVMELVEGVTLKQYIEKKGKLQIRESIGIAMQIAQGMEAAHERHIVHRDIKPQNIMISKDGKVKVTDFGIAKATSAQTINSATMGSVHYISPEQARGGYCDERSDIYSLGITMYEMLTGHVPFEGDSAVAVALMHIQGEMDSPLKYDSMIPVSLEKIIMKCTQKKPEQRYANVSLLIADLRRALMTPDEDFVKIVPLTSTGPTRVMSDEEMSQIKESYNHPDLGEENEDDIAFNEEQDYLMGIETGLDDLSDDEAEDEEDDEEDDEEVSKTEKTIIGVFIGVAVLILLLVIYLLLQFFGIIGKNNSTIDKTTDAYEPTLEATENITESSNKTVKMPDLSGMTEEEIEKALDAIGLVPKFRYQESSTVEEGYIISQTNAVGDAVKRGSTVQVVISAGTDIVTIPSDLSGKTTDEVRTILANLELDSKVDYDYSNEYAKGQVIRTTPGEGTIVAKGKTVTIYESMGKKPTVTIPTLTGKTRVQAEELLKGLKLKVTYKEDYSEEVKKDYVISQSIDAGNKVDENTSLTVVISLGTESVEMPDFITAPYSLEEAQKVLTELGLKVKEVSVTYRNDKTLDDFDTKVLIQYPEAKTPVNDSSNIYLNVIRTTVESMPKLVGMTESKAAETLKTYGMTTEVVKTPVTGVPVGEVAYAKFEDGTNVPVNSSVPVGSKIILTVSADSFKLPDVTGMTYSEAKNLLEKTYQLTVKKGDGVYGSVDTGKIAEQSPAAGTTVKVGAEITLQESLGKLTMPNVSKNNTRYDDAVKLLTAAPYNLKIDKAEVYSDDYAAGIVIEQSVAANSTLTSGSTVTLTVSLGKKPVTTAKVPSDLAGKNYNDAAQALASVGLAAAKNEEYSSTVAAGVVIRSDAAAGTELQLGATVTLTVSKGPQPIKVTNVVGKTYEQAVQELTSLGLTVFKAEENNDSVASGVVISQSILADTEVQKNTQITLTVSMGPEQTTEAPTTEASTEASTETQADTSSDSGGGDAGHGAS